MKIAVSMLTHFNISDVEGGVNTAHRYLTSTVIGRLVVADYDLHLPNSQLLTAAPINRLTFYRCNFNIVQDNALEDSSSELPHTIGCAGCARATLCDQEKLALTDEGVLDYSFCADLGSLQARGRTFTLTNASIRS